MPSPRSSLLHCLYEYFHALKANELLYESIRDYKALERAIMDYKGATKYYKSQLMLIRDHIGPIRDYKGLNKD